MSCPEWQKAFQQLLDGEAVADHPAFDRHLAECAGCRDLYAVSQSVAAALRGQERPLPPADLTERIVVRALAQRRAGLRWRRRLVAAAVAAGLSSIAVTVYSLPRPEDPQSFLARVQDFLHGQAPVDPAPAAVPIVEAGGPVGPQDGGSPSPAPASLNQSVEEVGTALAALTRRTADEAVGHTRGLLPDGVPAPARPDVGLLQKTLDPPARSLREAGQGVSAGLEPVTNSARRAVSLFLRDIPPMGVEAKPGT
jgi:hypothetical protein